jgi:hypothetical protein
LNSKNAKIAIAIGVAAIVVFITTLTIAELNIMRWITCQSPFANPVDQQSDVCKNLKKAP